MTFSLQDDAAILLGGWDDRTLADMLFMSVTTLRDRRRELKRPAPPVPALPKYRHHKKSRPWSDVQDFRLRGYRAQGCTLNVIAREMDRTVESVWARWRRLEHGKK